MGDFESVYFLALVNHGLIFLFLVVALILFVRLLVYRYRSRDTYIPLTAIEIHKLKYGSSKHYESNDHNHARPTGSIFLLDELTELSRRADGETCDGDCDEKHPCAECRARRAINEAGEIFREALTVELKRP